MCDRKLEIFNLNSAHSWKYETNMTNFKCLILPNEYTHASVNHLFYVSTDSCKTIGIRMADEARGLFKPIHTGPM